jgi:hypothetical protein
MTPARFPRMTTGIRRVDDLQIGTPNQIDLTDETKGARHG